MSTTTAVPHIYPSGARRLLSTKLRRALNPKPLVDFSPNGLQTGNCLAPVGAKVGREDKTWYLMVGAYCQLRKKLHSVIPQKKSISCDDESTDVEADAVDNTRRNTEPVNYWTIPCVEKFNRDDWEAIVSWSAFRESMPNTTQLPPPPFANADDYKEFFIPDIKKKTLAKTDKGRARFEKKMRAIWSDRKRLFSCGLQLLHDAGFFKHNSSVEGRPVDERHSCPRCGCTLFDSKGKKNLGARYPPATIHEKLVCHDCGYTPRPKTYDIRSADAEEVQVYSEIPLLRPRLTAKQFVAALLLRGKLQDLVDAEKRRKVSGSYLILCEKWLPRDVREAAFFDEPENTIKKRADRLYRAVKECQNAGNLLPEPDAESIAYLKETIRFA
jgi:hypothetical protein